MLKRGLMEEEKKRTWLSGVHLTKPSTKPVCGVARMETTME